jgi:hypothetical protein
MAENVKKSRPARFPESKQLFAFATGKPGWRLDSYVQRY